MYTPQTNAVTESSRQ